MKLEQFTGLANRVAPEAIPAGALVEALNVDVDDAGRLRRRRGATLVQAGGFHSLFAASDEVGYVVKDGDLCRFSPSAALEVIRAGVGGDPFTYVRVSDRVFARSRTLSLSFADQGPAQDWGIPLVSGFSGEGV